MVPRKAAISSLLGGAGGPGEPCDRQVLSRGARQLFAVTVWQNLDTIYIHPIWYLVSGKKLVPVAHAVVYHVVEEAKTADSIVFAFVCGRVSAQSLLAQANIAIWHYSSSNNAPRSYYSSRTLRAVALCVLTLPPWGVDLGALFWRGTNSCG